MNLLRVVKTLARKGAEKAVEHAPLGLLVVSLAGVAVGAYTLGKRASRAREVVDEYKTAKSDVDMEFKADLEAADQDKELVKGVKKTHRKAVLDLRIKLFVALLRTLALPIATIIFCVILGLWSHGIMVGRVASVTSALTVTQEKLSETQGKFEKYRENVRKDAGDEKDKEYATNHDLQMSEETITDEDGNEKVVKQVVDCKTSNDLWTIEFNRVTSSMWNPSNEMNRDTMHIALANTNHEYHEKTWESMNDVCRQFCIRPEFWTGNGQFVGFYSENKGTEPLSEIVMDIEETYFPVLNKNGRTTHEIGYLLHFHPNCMNLVQTIPAVY